MSLNEKTICVDVVVHVFGEDKQLKGEWKIQRACGSLAYGASELFLCCNQSNEVYPMRSVVRFNVKP